MFCQPLLSRDLDPDHTPIALHPDGLPPDFENIGMKNIIRGAGYPSVLLALAFLIMRLCAGPETKTRTRCPLDDYLCILAWVFTAANASTIMAQVGAYKHAWDMRVADLKPSYFRRMAASCILYAPSMFFAKASIFSMYVRIFGSVTWVRYTSWGVLAVVGVGYWSVVPTCAVGFFPHMHDSALRKGWDVDLERKTREAMVIPGLVVGVCNLAADLVALVIPIPVILSLRMNWKKKLGYCAMFFTGTMGIVISVLSLVYRINLIGPYRGDGTWWQAAVNLTTILELCIAVIISCAPFAIGVWRRTLRKSSIVNSLRSRYNLRKSDDPRPPTTVALPTIRTSRIGSTISPDMDEEVHGLTPRLPGFDFEETERRDSHSTGRNEHSFDTAVDESKDHLPFHAI